MPGRLLSLLAVSCLISLIHCQTDTVSALRASQYDPRASQGKRADREAYLDDLVANMTVPELGILNAQFLCVQMLTLRSAAIAYHVW